MNGGQFLSLRRSAAGTRLGIGAEPGLTDSPSSRRSGSDPAEAADSLGWRGTDPSRSRPIRSLLLVGLATLVGFGLRLWNIGALQVYGDGAYSVYLAGLDPASILRLTAQDSHPPVYYLLLWVTTGLAGASELTARLPSVAAGVAAIPLTYAVGARVTGRTAGFGGAWLVALSPFLIYYSRFPRMYTLLAALGLLSVYLLAR